MDLHDALDAARVVVARLKPLQALPEVIEAALTAEDAVRVAEGQKARLQAECDGLELDRARLADELNSERTAAEAERAERQAELVALSDKLHDERNRVQAEILTNEVKAQQAKQVLDEDYAARKVALQAEVAALEATRDELQKGVEAIREKYRGLVG